MVISSLYLLPCDESLADISHQNGRLGKITAVAINPGGMIDSRCLRTNTPESLAQLQQSLLATPLTDLQCQMGPTVRTAEPASADVVELALNPAYRGKCGFYTLLREDKSSPDSQNEEKQIKLWDKTLEWARITETNTALPLQHGLD